MKYASDGRQVEVPSTKWSVAMAWHDLLFMHWSVDAQHLSQMIPHGLTLDTHAGQAWIGVVAFRMSGIRHRLMPPVPGLSAFPELNVRTYVTCPGQPPGVWFFSLDAAHKLAVHMARWTFYLPYFEARMSVEKRDNGF